MIEFHDPAVVAAAALEPTLGAPGVVRESDPKDRPVRKGELALLGNAPLRLANDCRIPGAGERAGQRNSPHRDHQGEDTH